ncbi:MAG: hypothetical protein NTV33_11325 [Coprothermobacterota bacterium]|nr:hypothetical protein [Coprothermobacterota bacterium]
MTADFTFEADNIGHAFQCLSEHFLSLELDIDDAQLVMEGKNDIQQVRERGLTG